MVLGGLALAFSRLIDNSVVVLENIFRHLEMGETPEVAAEKGGKEVALPVLAATFTTAIVFFPVVFLYGVSRFLFTALALAVVLVAVRLVRRRDDGGAAVLREVHQESAHDEAAHHAGRIAFQRVRARGSIAATTRCSMQLRQRRRQGAAAARWRRCSACSEFRCSASRLYPVAGRCRSFPRTDPGQFVINVKAPTGTRLELTDQYMQAGGRRHSRRWFRRTTWT